MTAKPKAKTKASKPKAAPKPKFKVAPKSKAAPKAKTEAGKSALLKLVEQCLEDGKAEEISVIPLEGKSAIADYMVVASGTSQRQLAALADRLQGTLREAGKKRPAIEGLPHGDWVLVDAGDIIVHLFRPEQRRHYSLEKMWAEGFEAETA